MAIDLTFYRAYKEEIKNITLAKVALYKVFSEKSDGYIGTTAVIAGMCLIFDYIDNEKLSKEFIAPIKAMLRGFLKQFESKESIGENRHE